MSSFKSISPNLAFQYFREGQAEAELTLNDLIARFDQANFLNVIDRDLTSAPSSPSDGDTYLIPTSGVPTGQEWAEKEGCIAFYNEATLLFKTADLFSYSYWEYWTPFEGMRIWVADENKRLVYAGTAWIEMDQV